MDKGRQALANFGDTAAVYSSADLLKSNRVIYLSFTLTNTQDCKKPKQIGCQANTLLKARYLQDNADKLNYS